MKIVRIGFFLLYGEGCDEKEEYRGKMDFVH
jgi:hypothetical protein